MRLRQFYVYMLTNTDNNVIYIGVTNNLLRRSSERRAGEVEGFTKKYCTHKPVFYEICDIAEQAIAREKQLKNWHHDWKLNLIKSVNADMNDLYGELLGIPKQVWDGAGGLGDDAEMSSV